MGSARNLLLIKKVLLTLAASIGIGRIGSALDAQQDGCSALEDLACQFLMTANNIIQMESVQSVIMDMT